MAEQQNIVDDMKDISKIVNAVKTSANVLQKLSDLVVNINEKVSVKEFKKAAKNVKTLIGGINEFTTQLGDLVSQMTDSFKKDDLENLQKLFIDANEYKIDENGHLVLDKDKNKIITEAHSTLPAIICKISDSIGKIMQSMQNIGNINIVPTNILKMKIGFVMLNNNLSEVLDFMHKTFSALAADDRIKDLMNFLVSDPEKVIKTTDTSSSTKTSATSKVNTSDMSNTMKQREEIIRGKMGFLDAITAFLNILNTLNALEPPSFIIFKINMIKTKIMLKSVLSEMIKMQKMFGGDINKLNALAKPIESINSVLYEFSSITDTLVDIGGRYRKTKKAVKVLKKLNDIIEILQNVFESEKFKNLVSKSDQVVKDLKNINNILDEIESFSESIAKAETYIVIAGILVAPAMIALVGIAIFMVELWAVMSLMYILFNNKAYNELSETISNAAKAMEEIGLTIIILASTIIMLALTGALIKEYWKEILIGIGFILILVGVMFVAALATKFIKDGAKSMIFIALSIAILAGTVGILILISNLIEANMEQLKITFITLGVLVGAMFMLALASKFVKKGAMSLIFIGVALLIISASLIVLAAVADNLTWKKLGLIGAVIGTITALTIGLGIPAVAAFAFTGAAVLITIGISLLIFSSAIMNFIDVVQKISKMNLSADEKSKQTVAAPIELFKAVIEKVNEIKLITLTKATAKMISLMIIAASLGKMADVIQKVSAMTIPYEFDKEGKPTAYRRMTEDDFTSASKNIATILTTILTAIGSEDMTKILDNLKSKSLENITKVMESTSGVESLINAIEKAATFDEKTITDGALRIKQVITAYVGVLSDLFVGQGEWTTKSVSFLGRAINLPYYQVISEALIKTEDLNKSISGMKKLNNSIEKMIPLLDNMQTIVDKGSSIDGGIENIKKIVDVQEYFSKIDETKLNRSTKSFIRFVDKANTVDTKKIKTVTEMFEKMAKFSESIKGDFNALADVLSDKLVDILKKLHDTLEDINKTGTATVTTQQTLEPQTQQVVPVQQQAVPVQQEKQKQQKIDPEALKNIEDILTEMSSILKDVRENTENIGGY